MLQQEHRNQKKKKKKLKTDCFCTPCTPWFSLQFACNASHSVINKHPNGVQNSLLQTGSFKLSRD